MVWPHHADSANSPPLFDDKLTQDKNLKGLTSSLQIQIFQIYKMSLVSSSDQPPPPPPFDNRKRHQYEDVSTSDSSSESDSEGDESLRKIIKRSRPFHSQLQLSAREQFKGPDHPVLTGRLLREQHAWQEQQNELHDRYNTGQQQQRHQQPQQPQQQLPPQPLPQQRPQPQPQYYHPQPQPQQQQQQHQQHQQQVHLQRNVGGGQQQNYGGDRRPRYSLETFRGLIRQSTMDHTNRFRPCADYNYAHCALGFWHMPEPWSYDRRQFLHMCRKCFYEIGFINFHRVGECPLWGMGPEQ